MYVYLYVEVSFLYGVSITNYAINLSYVFKPTNFIYVTANQMLQTFHVNGGTIKLLWLITIIMHEKMETFIPFVTMDIVCYINTDLSIRTNENNKLNLKSNVR